MMVYAGEGGIGAADALRDRCAGKPQESSANQKAEQHPFISESARLPF